MKLNSKVLPVVSIVLFLALIVCFMQINKLKTENKALKAALDRKTVQASTPSPDAGKQADIFRKLQKRYPDIFDLINPDVEFTVKHETVRWVYDGDTVKTERYKVRMMGIDTPEIAHNPHETDQPGSREATEFTKQELMCKDVTLISESANKYDRHGRLVALIIYDEDKIFNIEIMKKGCAMARYYWHYKMINHDNWKKYRKYFKYQ